MNNTRWESESSVLDTAKINGVATSFPLWLWLVISFHGLPEVAQVEKIRSDTPSTAPPRIHPLSPTQCVGPEVGSPSIDPHLWQIYTKATEQRAMLPSQTATAKENGTVPNSLDEALHVLSKVLVQLVHAVAMSLGRDFYRLTHRLSFLGAGQRPTNCAYPAHKSY